MAASERVALRDLCSLITDGKHGDCQGQEGSGYFFLSCKDIHDGKLNYEDARQITHGDFVDTHRRTQLAPQDILITNSGTIGRMALVPDAPNTRRTTFQKSVAILKPDPDKVVPRWLYYSLQAAKESLIAYAGGTAQKNLLLCDMRSFTIDVPPLHAQQTVASILSAYDDLIENNQRRIRILEEMARNLYREWFVKFRFPGHEKATFVDSPLGRIPKGWEVGRLDDVLVLQRGFDLPKAQRVEGSVPIYAATGITGFHSEAKAKAPGVVTGRSGTIGEVIYVQEAFWPLNTALWVKAFPKSVPLYAYYLLSSLDLEQFNSGAAVPTLNRNDIHSLASLVPPSSLQDRFQAIAGAMHAQTHVLTRAVNNLRRTRDLLLPKLVSGEVQVIGQGAEP